MYKKPKIIYRFLFLCIAKAHRDSGGIPSHAAVRCLVRRFPARFAAGILSILSHESRLRGVRSGHLSLQWSLWRHDIVGHAHTFHNFQQTCSAHKIPLHSYGAQTHFTQMQTETKRIRNDTHSTNWTIAATHQEWCYWVAWCGRKEIVLRNVRVLRSYPQFSDSVV